MLKLFLSRITGKTSGVQDLRVTEQLDKQICGSEFLFFGTKQIILTFHKNRLKYVS